MNRDEIFLQELLRFREGVNINLGDNPPVISFNAYYFKPVEQENQQPTLASEPLSINVLDSTQLNAVKLLKEASANIADPDSTGKITSAFNILAAGRETLPLLINDSKKSRPDNSNITLLSEDVNSIFNGIVEKVNNYSEIYPGDNASTISQLKNSEKFTGALNYLPLILYRDHIDGVLAQGNLPKDSLVYGTDGRLVNGKTAQSLILSADNNAIPGSDIIAAYQPAGTKSGLEPNGRYSNFVCYLYYLDSLTGPNYTAPANVYTSKDKNTKYYRGTPKYIGMKDGMASAPTAEDASKEGTGKRITYFRPLTSIKNFSINGLLISDNDTILLPYIYNYIIESVEFAQYWFVEAKEEDSLNKDSGPAIKNISGFTKEEVEQVRNVMSGTLKNIAGNNGISMSQFGFAKESLSKSAIVRFKEAGEVEATGEEEATTTASNQTTKTTAKTTTSGAGGTLAAEITISLSDEDFEKLMKGPQEAPESNIQDDSSATTQEKPAVGDNQKDPEVPKADGQEEDATAVPGGEDKNPEEAEVETETPETSVEVEEEEVAAEGTEAKEVEANKEGDNGGIRA